MPDAKREGRLWANLAVGVVIAIVSSVTTGLIAAHNVDRQVSAALQQQEDASAEQQSVATQALARQAVDNFVQADSRLWQDIALFEVAAKQVATKAVALNDSVLVKKTDWNPAVYRLSLSDFDSGRTLLAAVDKLRLYVEPSTAVCADHLVLTSKVELCELSSLAGVGDIEWFTKQGLSALTVPGDLDDFLEWYSRLHRDLSRAFVEHSKAQLGLLDAGEAPPDPGACAALPAFIAHSSTGCTDTVDPVDECLYLTLDMLRHPN